MTDVDDATDATESTRVWLVERSYDDRNLITLVYATPDGERALRKERSATVMQQQGSRTTAALDAAVESLTPVDPVDRDRYAAEAERMRDRHDPDDEV
ncbi:hypothetical protein [Salinigranum salinum]|uniref:hypothetical protein n=1 Tax=Salinigranum salinum TaxID=1364937 RepID=UPI001261247F|nr:hypothetical protein [Salinigranum salinum]